jgi:RNA polymerase sigma-70 factor, ECF subfamily
LQQRTNNVRIDDTILVRRAQSGEKDAIARLVLRYQDRVFNVILKICGNYDDAAELTQETFVKLIEKIGTFKYKSSFYTWLFRVAVNLTLNYCKRRNKISMTSIDQQVGTSNGSAKTELVHFLEDKSSIEPAQMAQKKEVGQILLAGLNILQDHQRTIIVLRDIESMSYEDIAKALDIELGTVKSRISRARKKLKEILAEILK